MDDNEGEIICYKWARSHWMQSKTGSSEKICPIKLRQAKSWGQGSGQPKRRPTDKETLVCVSNEVTIEIEPFTCSALIDTGATVCVKIRPRLFFA